jgi:hypothetical protein
MEALILVAAHGGLPRRRKRTLSSSLNMLGPLLRSSTKSYHDFALGRKNQMHNLLAATAMCVLTFCNSAIAGEATCADYARAKGEDRSLFNGFIYGFVMAKIGERGDAEVNTATARVKELADGYCFARSIISIQRLSTAVVVAS